jgi:hypothetical protein
LVYRRAEICKLCKPRNQKAVVRRGGGLVFLVALGNIVWRHSRRAFSESPDQIIYDGSDFPI